MSARKSERIMNLTICLLMARRYLSRDQIRQAVEGYHNLTDAAFERTFERDKDELRSMGVPLETGSNSAFYDDELGYRIRRTDFELPPVEFTPDELTVLGLAGRVWEEAALAEEAVRAMAKLRAAGLEPDPAPLTGLLPSVGAREPAFEPLLSALFSHTRVTFAYHGRQRRVEPWHLTFRNGSWYLLGFDSDRADKRVFKLSRMTDLPRPVGGPGAFQVPGDVDLAALLRSLEPAVPDSEAVIAIRRGRAADLRRSATPVPREDLPPGFAAYRVPYAREGDVVGELCRHADDVVVLEPVELRRAVIAHLSFIAGGER